MAAFALRSVNWRPVHVPSPLASWFESAASLTELRTMCLASRLAASGYGNRPSSCHAQVVNGLVTSIEGQNSPMHLHVSYSSSDCKSYLDSLRQQDSNEKDVSAHATAECLSRCKGASCSRQSRILLVPVNLVKGDGRSSF